MTFKKNKVLILFIIFFAACSNNHEALDSDETAHSTPFVVLDLPDNIVNVINAIDKVQYANNCIREVYYYCPPLDEINRAKAIVDICRDNKVLSISDCEEVLECIPTSEVVDVVECVDEDGMNGFQNVYCYKGFYEYGACVPCEEEICDGLDNDCDGETDEGEYPCSTECGDGKALCINGELQHCDAAIPKEEICNGLDDNCNGEIDEGQLNACGKCGPVPDEICDGVDNDCDGLIDEDLIGECYTACEKNLEYCVGGIWICTAKQPKIEVCNGLDDDCDGKADEGLDCLCTINDIGALFPCKEKPLICGEGFKTCECVDEDCTELQLTECWAACYWLPQITPPGSTCDKYLGEIKPEECNNHDDNCNQLVDENLFKGCYSGPPETMGVGICLPGEMTCLEGKWGSYDDNSQFVNNLCLGEITPEPEDICNGTDANCDGKIDEDKEMVPTDILFIVDLSGSMYEEINAVMTALNTFATYYSDSEVIKWGLVFTASYGMNGSSVEEVVLQTDLVDFQTFMANFQSTGFNLNGSIEQNYDAIYLAIHNLIGAAALPYQLTELEWAGNSWESSGSYPEKENWNISWRNDAKHVIILFSDEEGQSYFIPKLTEPVLVDMINAANDLAVYVFTSKNVINYGGVYGYESLTLAGSVGKLYELTTGAVGMYNKLLEILDETACGDN